MYNQEEARDLQKRVGVHIVRKCIEEGIGLDRYPENMRGEIAKKSWESSLHRLFAEYGYILALMDIYGLTENDFKAEHSTGTGT